MKKLLAFGLTVAVALVSITAASSARPDPKVVRLNRQVKLLQHRLHNMTVARNALQTSLGQANTQNAALRAQVPGLQSEVVGLQVMLKQRTSERDAARAQVSSLQAQLSTVQLPTAAAYQQVQREVGWAQAVGDSHSAGTLTSLSAMNYVVGHVSAGAYGYLELNDLPLPGTDPDLILGGQAGICGNATIAFATIMEHFGYAVQSVQFYWTLADGTQDNHIALEVYYDGAWHYFDPTFGLYWTDANGSVLSITDERSSAGTEHKDDAGFTSLIEDPWFAGDDTAFETDPATTVDIGAQPLEASLNHLNNPLLARPRQSAATMRAAYDDSMQSEANDQ